MYLRTYVLTHLVLRTYVLHTYVLTHLVLTYFTYALTQLRAYVPAQILAYSFSSTSRRGYRSSLASPVTSSQLRPKSAGADPGRHDPIWLPVGLAIR